MINRKNNNEKNIFLNEILMVYPQFASYCDFRLLLLLTHTTKVLSNKINSTWQMLYKNNFYVPSKEKYIKKQFILESMYQEYLKERDTTKKTKLLQVINLESSKYLTESWALFFVAISTVNYDESVRYALSALKRNEFRIINYIGQRVLHAPQEAKDVNGSARRELLKTLANTNDALDKTKITEYNNLNATQTALHLALAYVNSTCYRHALTGTSKTLHYDSALKHFSFTLAAPLTSANSFVNEAYQFFTNLGLLTVDLQPRVWDSFEKTKYKNNKIDILLQCFNYGLITNYLYDILPNYVKHIPQAAFYLAEKKLKKLNLQRLQNPDLIHFHQEIMATANLALLAIKGNDFRAANYFKLLDSYAPQLGIKTSEVNAQIDRGIKLIDPYCVLARASEFSQSNVHEDPYKMWIVQLAATYDLDPNHYALYFTSNNRLNCPYFACAKTILECIFGDLETAKYIRNNFAMDYFDDYLAIGRRNNFLTKRDEQLIEQLQLENDTIRMKM